jgi:hypothetical protein
MRIKAGKLKAFLRETMEKLYGDLPFENQESTKAIGNELEALVKAFRDYNKKNPNMKMSYKWDQEGVSQKLNNMSIDEIWKKNVDLAADDLFDAVFNAVNTVHERMSGEYYLSEIEADLKKYSTGAGKISRPPEAKDGSNYDNRQS